MMKARFLTVTATMNGTTSSVMHSYPLFSFVVSTHLNGRPFNLM